MPFRFQAMWLSHKNFPDYFKSSWDSYSGNIMQKSDSLAKALKIWNKNIFGNIFNNKRALLARICGIHKFLASATNSYLLNLEKSLTADFFALRNAEALFWKQKSRDKWLKEGDSPKFFHLTTVIRRRKNKIMGLYADDGIFYTAADKLQQIAVRFFKNLFSTQNDSRIVLNVSSKFPLTSTDDLNRLGTPVTPQEIFSNLFQIGRFKAPGVDGFPAAFFQDQWQICGSDVTRYITSIFENSTIPQGLNHTLIALVPKTNCPQEMRLFRPISLCCTIYKVISKIIVSRLRPLLCNWISPNQVSYVPGRHISDNIMIVQELVHKFRHSSGKKGLLAWKIDLSKAYDKLSWDFIHQVLSELQLPCNLIALIMSCISSTSFQILINGDLSESFHGNRGIRQGDPLSPYLFVLCMEKLSHLINDKVDDKKWKPVKATRFGPFISHLFFADDLILFSEASPKQAKILKNTMDLFCHASGQSVNFEKSVIYCSPNINAGIANQISVVCGSPLTNDLGRYLGMPIIHSRTGKHTYANLIDKVQARLASWKCKTLNIAGRLTLIQSVTSAIPSYAMQTAKLSIHTCDRLDKINRNFLWGDSSERKRVHLVNWNAVCRPKSIGGLGIKKTRDMNQAMLAKSAWRILQDDKGLWCQIFKLKYLTKCSSLQNYIKPAACSNVWSSINHGLSLLQKGIKWRIGDGSTVNFWTDAWSDYGMLADHAIMNSQITLSAKVCDFWSHKCWNSSMLAEHLPPDIVNHICAIPISHASDKDKIIWGASSSGDFSVKSAYLLHFDDTQAPRHSWSKIWKLNIPPKIKVFLWTNEQRLLTNEQRLHRNFTTDSSCFHCPGTAETLLHLFRDCPKARMVWNSFYIPPSIASAFYLGWNAWISANLLHHSSSCLNAPWNTVFIFICWHIWKWRCKCVFDRDFNLPYNMSTIILAYIEEWSSASRSTQAHNSKHPVQLHWHKPPPGFLKVNVDGTHTVSGQIGAGGILRDCSGNWCSGFMINLGTGITLQAEAWSMFYGMQLALRLNAQHIEFESDSADLVNLLNNGDISVHPLGTIFANCKLLSSNFLTCSIRHVHRESNFVADILAKGSLANDPGIIWLEQAPTSIAHALKADQDGTSTTRRIVIQNPHCSSSHGA